MWFHWDRDTKWLCLISPLGLFFPKMLKSILKENIIAMNYHSVYIKTRILWGVHLEYIVNIINVDTSSYDICTNQKSYIQ